MDEEIKFQLRIQGHRLKRGIAGIAYGNAIHLLDAGVYVEEAWQSVSPSSVQNAFVKVEIMTLETYQ